MKRMRMICGGVIAASLLAPGVAWAQNRVEQQVFLELRALQEQNRQLMQAVNVLSEQLKTITTKVDSEATARTKGFADQQLLINAANSGLSALQERISENKVQVQKASQEVDAVRKGVDMLTVMVTQALAQLPASPPPVDPNAPEGSAAAPPTAGGVPPSSEQYFQRAFADYTVGQWDAAIQGFQEYVKEYPNAPSAALAQLYVCQSHFMMGKYQDAVAACGDVIRKYKGGDPGEAVPDAYYKQATAYEQLKQVDRAVENYQLLRREYPNSNAALQAGQDLKRLGK